MTRLTPDDITESALEQIEENTVKLQAELDAVRAERDEARERPHGHEDAGWKRADACEADLAAAREALTAKMEEWIDIEQHKEVQIALAAAQARLAEQTPTHFAAIATTLKEECERQHTRAERAETTLAAIRAEVSVIDRSHVDGWYVAQRVLALLDAQPSPEKG